jgi:hypothetical protein
MGMRSKFLAAVVFAAGIAAPAQALAQSPGHVLTVEEETQRIQKIKKAWADFQNLQKTLPARSEVYLSIFEAEVKTYLALSGQKNDKEAMQIFMRQVTGSNVDLDALKEEARIAREKELVSSLVTQFSLNASMLSPSASGVPRNNARKTLLQTELDGMVAASPSTDFTNEVDVAKLVGSEDAGLFIKMLKRYNLEAYVRDIQKPSSTNVTANAATPLSDRESASKSTDKIPGLKEGSKVLSGNLRYIGAFISVRNFNALAASGRKDDVTVEALRGFLRSLVSLVPHVNFTEDADLKKFFADDIEGMKIFKAELQAYGLQGYLEELQKQKPKLGASNIVVSDGWTFSL